MKYVNIIGILIILILSTLGNRIAPGRYCTYIAKDTISASILKGAAANLAIQALGKKYN